MGTRRRPGGYLASAPVVVQGLARPRRLQRPRLARAPLLAVGAGAFRWCATFGVEGGYDSLGDGDGEAAGTALCPSPAYQWADDHPPNPRFRADPSDWLVVMGIRLIPGCKAAGSRKAVWWMFCRG